MLVFKENLGLRVWGSGKWFRRLGPRESDHRSEMGGDMWWAKPKTMVMVNRDYDDDDGDLGDDACCVSVTLSGFLQNRTRAPLSDDSQAQAPMGMSKKRVLTPVIK